jgi:murein L,D-transpeptidase YcbB/YkuD
VPPGILATDVLPALKRGENVLERKHPTLLDREGRPVDPTGIRWSSCTAGDFPYLLRQDAGEANALGRVKINFPNPHLVSLHDTPRRSLFEKSSRTFSSGCIRVDRSLELAEPLLADPARWNPASIPAAVDAGTTLTVSLERNVPVLLIYWTADSDPEGRVIIKPDVDHPDPRLLRRLDGDFRFGSRVRA